MRFLATGLRAKLIWSDVKKDLRMLRRKASSSIQTSRVLQVRQNKFSGEAQE